MFSNIKGDISGAISAAIITLPMCIGYGIIVFEPLGSEYAPLAAMTGVYCAVFAGFLAAFFGGNPIQITGPKALLMFVQGSLVSYLATSEHIPELGDARYIIVVGLASISVLIAGIFQVLFAALRFGDLTKYVPHPVIAGFTNGIGILLIMKQIRPILGVESDVTWIGILEQSTMIQPLTLVVGLTTLAALYISKRFIKMIPSSLMGLLVGTALYYLFTIILPNFEPGRLIGTIRFTLPKPDIFSHLFYLGGVEKVRILFSKLVITAFFLALLSSMETLLSSVTSDNLSGNRHNSKRELIGQGIGNIVTAFFGSLAAAGSVPRTMANFKAGGRTPLSGMLCGIFIFLIMMFLGPLVGKVPRSVIAGVLIAVGFTLFDKWTLKFLWKLRNPFQQQKDVLINFLITVIVTVSMITIDLTYAVGIGMVIASALFVSKMGKSIIKRKYFGSQFHSKKMRSQQHSEILEKEGDKIIVFELQGPIFFGSADNLFKEIEASIKQAVYCILDMRRVNEIDSTGTNILLQISNSIQKDGKYLLISYVRENRALWEFLKVMNVVEMLSREKFFSDTDRALEWAEEHLLKHASCDDQASYLTSFFTKVPERRSIALSESDIFKTNTFPVTNLSVMDELLGIPELSWQSAKACTDIRPDDMNIVNGFTSEELSDFKEKLICQTFKKGEPVFREGDPGKDLFLLTKGAVSVKIQLQESNRLKRLFTFSAGVIFGEVALLDGKPRSADVWAEEDVEVFRLSLDNFNALRKEKPEIVIKLLLNIAKEFSRNMRRISNEVRALEDA